MSQTGYIVAGNYLPRRGTAAHGWPQAEAPCRQPKVPDQWGDRVVHCDISGMQERQSAITSFWCAACVSAACTQSGIAHQQNLHTCDTTDAPFLPIVIADGFLTQAGRATSRFELAGTDVRPPDLSDLHSGASSRIVPCTCGLSKRLRDASAMRPTTFQLPAGLSPCLRMPTVNAHALLDAAPRQHLQNAAKQQAHFSVCTSASLTAETLGQLLFSRCKNDGWLALDA